MEMSIFSCQYNQVILEILIVVLLLLVTFFFLLHVLYHEFTTNKISTFIIIF